ncbi:hypothetical protein ACTQ4E_11480 [Lawsonibacter sp. LCP25S3_G6]|uniref:hypothetical protein n=1 Tax=unclassified Lawsonibacter TaxID=2617946 RepID=UPI003F98A317
MLHYAGQTVEQLRLGEMGIKSAALGEDPIYVRPGGYVFLELCTEKESENDGKLL